MFAPGRPVVVQANKPVEGLCALVSTLCAKTLDLAGPTFCLAKPFQTHQLKIKVNAAAAGIAPVVMLHREPWLELFSSLGI